MGAPEERIAGLTKLSAEEIMALTMLVKDASHEAIASRLKITPTRVAQLETSIHVKIGVYGIPSIDARRRFTREAHEEYFRRATNGEKIDYGKPKIADQTGSAQKAPTRLDALRVVAQRLIVLPGELKNVADRIGEGLNNFELAEHIGSDVNSAGQLVARLYAALGLARSLGKRRRTAVQDAIKLLNGSSGPAHAATTARTGEVNVQASDLDTVGKVRAASLDHGEQSPSEPDMDVRILARNIVALSDSKLRSLRAMAKYDFREDARSQAAIDLNVADVTLKNYLSTTHAALGFPQKMSQARRASLLLMAWRLCAGELSMSEHTSTVATPATTHASAPTAVSSATRDEIERIAERMASLKENERSTIVEVVQAGFGNGDAAARRLGIGAPSLSVRMSEIYKKLDLSVSLGRKERQRVLGLALGRYRGKLASAMPAAPIAPPDLSLPAPPVPQAESSAGPAVVKEEAQIAAVSNDLRAEEVPVPSADGVRVKYAPPVVIQLSESDTIAGVHVITRFVNDRGPTNVFDADIRRLAALGFRPENLVTVPTEDGTGSLVQLQFTRRSN